MSDLLGANVEAAINEQSIADISRLEGFLPCLAIVRVGEDPSDISYEKGIISKFGKYGAKADVYTLNKDCTMAELEGMIIKLNEDKDVHGILMFRPLPKHLSEERVMSIIAPQKDVDCMGYIGIAKLMGCKSSYNDFYPPCTAQSAIEILKHYGYPIAGKKAVIIGRSLVIGKSVAMLLLAENATVTVCHTKTADLCKECREADILIAAAGKAKMIDDTYVREGQVVIDVGINMVDGKLCGDVDYDKVSPIVAAITPVPKGVGRVTTSVLLSHTVKACLKALDA